MTTTAILPDKPTLENLGNVKKNAYPVENPDIDLDALDWNETAANVVCLARTAINASVVIDFDGASIASVDSFYSVWGGTTNPTIATASTGIYTVTFDSSVSDPLIDSGDAQYTGYSNHSVALRWGIGSIYCSGSTFYVIMVARTAANVITFKVYDSGNALIAPANSKVTILAG